VSHTDLIPRNKHDFERVGLLRIADKEKIIPILPRTQSVEAYSEFLLDYDELVMALYEDAPCNKLAVEVTEGDWQTYEERIYEEQLQRVVTEFPDRTI
jgi:hypothetical protein